MHLFPLIYLWFNDIWKWRCSCKQTNKKKRQVAIMSMYMYTYTISCTQRIRHKMTNLCQHSLVLDFYGLAIHWSQTLQVPGDPGHIFSMCHNFEALKLIHVCQGIIKGRIYHWLLEEFPHSIIPLVFKKHIIKLTCKNVIKFKCSY